jgi:hypothetical protein
VFATVWWCSADVINLFSSFSAPRKLLPLSLYIFLGFSRLAMNRRNAARKASVEALLTSSMMNRFDCEADVIAKQMNNAI